MVGLVASACGSSSSSGSISSTTKPTTSIAGHPNLSGETLVIDVGSPTPVLSKATAYVAVRILDSWGAQVTLDNIGACGRGGELVITGKAQVTLCPASVALNSGLVAFGSNQPRANYLLVGKKTIETPSALAGKVVGLNNPTGTEATLLPELEHQYHATGVSTVVLGTQPVLLGALASGRMDAGLVLPEQWIALQKKAPSLHLLATVATALPNFADSYLLAQRSWLTSHHALALAIDEAWLQARKVFNHDEASWVAAAQAYTSGNYPISVAQTTWQEEHGASVWPDDGFGFSTTVLTYNAQIAYTTHAAKRLLPVSQWTDETIWKDAASQVFGSNKG
ncbi:MAG: ABC transporter substrate-binding protein [Acidimicrobiales bacterium]